LIRHVKLRHHGVDALCHCGAERVVDVHENDRLRRAADDLEKLELIGEGAAKQHLRRREIPEDEFVTLLGNLRSSIRTQTFGSISAARRRSRSRWIAQASGANTPPRSFTAIQSASSGSSSALM